MDGDLTGVVVGMDLLTKPEDELMHFVGEGTSCKALCQWIADANGINVMAGPVESNQVI